MILMMIQLVDGDNLITLNDEQHAVTSEFQGKTPGMTRYHCCTSGESDTELLYPKMTCVQRGYNWFIPNNEKHLVPFRRLTALDWKIHGCS